MIVQGVKINLAALSDVKSLADLKKLNIFIHLADADKANAELWEKMKPATTPKQD